MICYLIDPYARTITEATIACGDELELRVLVGDECRATYLWHGCKRPELQSRDALFTHDWQSGPGGMPPVHWRTVQNEPCSFPGRAVILGHTEDGEPCSPATPLARVLHAFTFEEPRS
jgi:hypothetical protein